MAKEFKYSAWYMGGKLILLLLFSIIIDFIILSGLLNIFTESVAWSWIVTALTILVNITIIYLFVSNDGKRDIQIDATNEKRELRNENFVYFKKFSVKKGFLAGLIAQIPLLIFYITYIILQSMGNDIFIFEFLVRGAVFHYYMFLLNWGLNAFFILGTVVIFVMISGFSYLSGRAYRRKVLTIIKRNAEKAKIKGIISK